MTVNRHADAAFVTPCVLSHMSELYQACILAHNKHPKHRSALAHASHRAQGRNPLCGESLALELQIQDGQLLEIGFQGELSAVSTAATSMMCAAVAGQRLARVEALTQAAFALLLGTEAEAEVAAASLGEFAAMRILRAHPNRIKLATLPWATLRHAMAVGFGAISTDHAVTGEVV
jgi:nitrogen fixation protein NifU and related proteins